MPCFYPQIGFVGTNRVSVIHSHTLAGRKTVAHPASGPYPERVEKVVRPVGAGQPKIQDKTKQKTKFYEDGDD